MFYIFIIIPWCLFHWLTNQSADIFCKEPISNNLILCLFNFQTHNSWVHRGTNSSKMFPAKPSTVVSVSVQTPFTEGWLTLQDISHIFLILPHHNTSRKRLNCILDEVSNYYTDLSGMKAIPINHSSGRKRRTDLTSQAGVQALRHFVIKLAYWLFWGID